MLILKIRSQYTNFTFMFNDDKTQSGYYTNTIALLAFVNGMKSYYKDFADPVTMTIMDDCGNFYKRGKSEMGIPTTYLPLGFNEQPNKILIPLNEAASRSLDLG